MEYYNSKGERIIYNLNKPKYQGKSSQIFELESLTIKSQEIFDRKI